MITLHEKLGRYRFYTLYWFILLMVLAVVTPVLAGGISLDRTRVVFNANEKSDSIGVVNRTAAPWLVQARIVDAHGQGKSPLFIAPPLFRLEPSTKHTLRLIPSTPLTELSPDREEIGYLHIDAVPLTSNAEESSQLDIGVGMSIKVFIRPDALAIPDESVWQSIQWHATPKAVKSCNTSPYYLSFNRLSFDGNHINLNTHPSMLPPYDCLTFDTGYPVANVRWSLIEDNGGDSGDYSSQLLKEND